MGLELMIIISFGQVMILQIMGLNIKYYLLLIIIQSITHMPQISTHLLIFLLFLLCLCLHIPITLSQTPPSYTLQMSPQQYTLSFSAYIAEFNGKRCYVRSGYDPDVCKRYCLQYYDYVPSLPYKNAQNYNPVTRLCEPRKYCPKSYGVGLDEATGKCIDRLLGIQVQGVDAPVPVYSYTTTVTIICENGVVKEFNGKPDCQCAMGWGSLPIPNFSTVSSFKKCSQRLSISMYFPNFLKIYYDESYDNMFPYASDPDYWPLLIQYYIRSIKYSIITFFVPYEVQLILIVIPQEPTLRPVDWIWCTWLIGFFGILGIGTLYERCIGRKNDGGGQG